jgi:DNA-directed RNA polymerase subunit RPC12/RpoP
MQTNQSILNQSSVVAWVLDNNLVTETGTKVEFKRHKFLIDYLEDQHEDICAPKAAQIGATVAETLDEIHTAYYKKLSTIHTLQNSDVIRGFVAPKVNPIIYNNPAILEMLRKDSENLKQFGDGFVFYRGAQAESQAINISAEILKIDEMDRSNQRVVEMFQSRLDAAKARGIQPKVRRFSNPSAIGFGVDAYWQKSNQFHWFVRCTHCSHHMYIDWEKDDSKSHYVDRIKQQFVCGNCGKELTDEDRRTGNWYAKWANRTDRHGYWFSQLMCSWFTAKDIIKKFDDNSIDYFYNFVLGKAYTPADMRLDRQSILDNVLDKTVTYQGAVMGSDIGKPHWYWVATPQGYIACGHAESWEQLETIFLTYNCQAWVTDAAPEYTMSEKMVKKYPGKVWACTFSLDTKNIGVVRWGQKEKAGTVNVDRTKMIDKYVTEINNKTLPFLIKPTELETFITHAANMYRQIETDEKGMVRIRWLTPEGKPDHLVLAGVYCRVALEQSMGVTGSALVSPKLPTEKKSYIVEDGKLQGMHIDPVALAKESNEPTKDWKHN